MVGGITRHSLSNFCLSFLKNLVGMPDLRIEFRNSIAIYMFLFGCFCFSLINKLLNSFKAAFLVIKMKRYLHASYIQLFDYLRIRDIHIRLTYTEDENSKPQYFSPNHNLFLQPQERNLLGQKSVRKL